jgi:uncharacterized protein (DUF697 family)
VLLLLLRVALGLVGVGGIWRLVVRSLVVGSVGGGGAVAARVLLGWTAAVAMMSCQRAAPSMMGERVETY